MISKENLKDFYVVAKRDSFYKMYVNLNQQVFVCIDVNIYAHIFIEENTGISQCVL